MLINKERLNTYAGEGFSCICALPGSRYPWIAKFAGHMVVAGETFSWCWDYVSCCQMQNSVAAAFAKLVFAVTVGFAKNISKALAVLSFSEGATTSASTLNIPRILVGVFADVTKSSAGRNEFCQSPSVLKQRVGGCAAWFTNSKEVMK